MPLDTARARQLLVKGDLRNLFIEELGWDRHATDLQITLDGTVLTLPVLAQKRGMAAYQCPAPDGGRLPDYAQRRKIERQVAKAAHEHVIVFTDAGVETQIWQWVKREPGKPAACREHTFHRSQTGDALLQKLRAIAFTLEEEEQLSLTDVTRRARSGFDVERVTKRFYDRFQKEHTAFLEFITGITERADHEWYASVMLNRLMFVYFIQRKGFLDGDRDYLRNRLNRTRGEHGKDKFYSFYRYFLLRLFHEGLGGLKRSTELEALIGRIPYLNGGLFDVHELERPDRYGEAIQIPDQAFERIFDYFDQYQWHLDERPLRADNEINPDVLGYIFEKYINQKQMGAYYTKEDITEYIGKNTVLPFLLDAAKAKCKVAFENPKGPTVWNLLSGDPDRYIYAAVRHGAGEPLPDDIAAGLNPPTLHQPVGDGPVQTLELRKGWNRSAPPTHALPTETWREVIARRKRYEEVKARLAAGEVHDVNDLITLNLDIRQFAQDVVENCEGPDLLRACWHAIEKVTILDPTCGSGAFLFAALNILEPLYEACLERMEAFVGDLERSGRKHRPEKYSDFRKILAHVAAHPNRRYFIFKSIILNNLFGVDIMEEAVEICKLRLFLKLAAQVEPDAARDNLGIEPLPDIDFNIRAGNTLVGYATYDEVLESAEGDWVRQEAIEQIRVRASDLQQAFDAFRARQVEGDGSVPTEDKQGLRKRLRALDDELNRHLATEYGVAVSKKDAYAKWLKSHQPFHWFVEFYGIVSGGGFDVIIGNPPFVEYAKIRGEYVVRDYRTEACGNLYTYVVERATTLAGVACRSGFIIPMSGMSSRRTQEFRELLMDTAAVLHVSSYAGDAHPSILFEGVRLRLSIVICAHARSRQPLTLYTTAFQRWYSAERPLLFHRITLWPASAIPLWNIFLRLGGAESPAVWAKLLTVGNVARLTSRLGNGATVFYQEAAQYFVKASGRLPYFAKNGTIGAPPHGRFLNCAEAEAPALMAVLSSTLFYLWYHGASDCYHVSDAIVQTFPCPRLVLSDPQLRRLGKRLEIDLHKQAKRVEISTNTGDKIVYAAFNCQASKLLNDEIDTVLAEHFGLTEEELDFVINYDIKYRMGREAEDEDE